MKILLTLLNLIWPTVRLPTLSDGKKRWVTSKEYARLSSLAIAANKPLREFLELGGGLERSNAKKPTQPI